MGYSTLRLIKPFSATTERGIKHGLQYLTSVANFYMKIFCCILTTYTKLDNKDGYITVLNTPPKIISYDYWVSGTHLEHEN